MDKIYLIALVLFCGFLGAIGQIFLKLGSKNFNLDLSLLTNWNLIFGLGLYAVATIIFIFALKQGNLSILYPIIATSYVWVAIFSKYFLNEPFPLYKWTGIVLILIAVGIITN